MLHALGKVLEIVGALVLFDLVLVASFLLLSLLAHRLNIKHWVPPPKCKVEPEVSVKAKALLGPQMVAYILRLHTCGHAAEVLNGHRKLEAFEYERLKTAVDVAAQIAAFDGASTAEIWMQGQNPDLADYTPARYLREAISEERFEEVRTAVDHYLAYA